MFFRGKSKSDQNSIFILQPPKGTSLATYNDVLRVGMCLKVRGVLVEFQDMEKG